MRCRHRGVCESIQRGDKCWSRLRLGAELAMKYSCSSELYATPFADIDAASKQFSSEVRAHVVSCASSMGWRLGLLTAARVDMYSSTLFNGCKASVLASCWRLPQLAT